MEPASDISTIRELKKDLLEGKVVPFLGAGASISAGFPGGSSLGTELVGKFKVIACKDLARVASLCVVESSHRHLSAYLQDRFREEKDPSRLHCYLANLPKPLLIVTTNYDRLMETALEKAGKLYDVLIYRSEDGQLLLQRGNGKSEAVRRSNDLARLVDPNHRWLIYKIHGSVSTHPEEPGCYVITEEDYENALIGLRTFLPPLIVSLLDNKRLLFMGYSLKDWNIRAILRQLTLHSHYRGHLGFLRTMDKVDQKLWRTRELGLRKMELEDLVDALEAA